MHNLSKTFKNHTCIMVFSCASLTMNFSCKPDVQPKISSPALQQKKATAISSIPAMKQSVKAKETATNDAEVNNKTSEKKPEKKPDYKALKSSEKVKVDQQKPDKTSYDIGTPPRNKAPKAAKKTGPAIKFDKIRHDFGTITEGDVINNKFEFTNNGTEPLIIQSSNATCGCTLPSYPFVPIEPGETGYIGVRYNSVGKSGEQKPLITITTNASIEPITLMLFGNVEDKEKAKDNKAENDLPSTRNTVAKDSLKGK